MKQVEISKKVGKKSFLFLKAIFIAAIVVAVVPTAAHASFSYTGAPHIVSTTGADKKTTITVELSIVSTTTENEMLVTISPPDQKYFGQPVYFEANIPQNVIFSDLAPITIYDVAVKKRPLTPSNELVTVAQLTSFTTRGVETTSTQVGTPTTNAPVAVDSKSTTEQNPTATNNSTGATFTPYSRNTVAGGGKGSCADGIDNDKDGRIDYYGTADAEPDPSCLTPESEETQDSVAKGSIVPCTDKCELSDVFILINNIISFVVTVLLIPAFVLMIMYTGYQYLMARGNPAVHTKLKSLIIHILGGMVLILCAWLIVKTIMSTLGYTDGLVFFE